MQNAQVLKMQIKFAPDDTSGPAAMQETMNHYRDACDLISQHVFDRNFKFSTFYLHAVFYKKLTDKTSKMYLKAQMAQSTTRTVAAQYKALETKQHQKAWGWNNPDTKKWVKERAKDLTDLWHPIHFKRPQVDLVFNRDWSVLDNWAKLSLNTIRGRVIVTPITTHWEKYLTGTWKFGTAKVIKSGQKWFVHISVAQEVPEVPLESIQRVVGMDRGLINILTAYNDETGETEFVSGKKLLNRRRYGKQQRKHLQQKKTSAARQRLKKIGHRENGWVTNMNHQLAKALLDFYGPGTLFSIEKLNDIREALEKSPKDKKYERVSWPYYQLEQFLLYKAQQYGCIVIKVDAHYTSQHCPKCGTIDKSARNHQLHEYHCKQCDFRTNDDRVAAMNLAELGRRYLAGDKEPSFDSKKQKKANRSGMA
jgi:IS605 OrfB family transposase